MPKGGVPADITDCEIRSYRMRGFTLKSTLTETTKPKFGSFKATVEKLKQQHLIDCWSSVPSQAASDFVEPDTYLDIPPLFERMIAADKTAATLLRAGDLIDIGLLEGLGCLRAKASTEGQP